MCNVRWELNIFSHVKCNLYSMLCIYIYIRTTRCNDTSIHKRKSDYVHYLIYSLRARLINYNQIMKRVDTKNKCLL